MPNSNTIIVNGGDKSFEISVAQPGGIRADTTKVTADSTAYTADYVGAEPPVNVTTVTH